MYKKLILILLLFLTIGIANSQTLDTTKWKPIINISTGEYSDVINVTEFYGLDSGTVRIPLSLALQYETFTAVISNFSSLVSLIDSALYAYILGEVPIRNVYDWVRITRSNSDTITVIKPLWKIIYPSSVDSNASHFYSKWWSYTLDNPDDTIECSDTVTFTAGRVQTILPVRAWNSPKYDVSMIKRIYFRIKGTGTATLYPTINGY